jgi:hypothetical protein
MTSLGADAYVGTLHYKVLDPPVSGGGENLQQTLTIGNDTNLPINFNGVPVNLSQAGDERIKIGNNAGTTSQSGQAVAIGKDAGASRQSESALAVGVGAGNTLQGIDSIAIGNSAGNGNQGQSSIAIGASAGRRNQGINCIAIGTSAGATAQRNDSICIGGGAGDIRCDDGCIIINGGGISLISGGINRCYINPIRGLANPAGGVSGSLWYNPVLKEVLYNP